MSSIAILGLDITEQKQSETALQAWTAFAQFNPAPILRFDQQDHILLANSAAHDVFGYHTLKDLSIAEIFPECGPETFFQSIQQDSTVRFETHNGDQDYQFVVSGVSALCIGHVYGSNITERKRAEEELRRNEARLESILRLHQMTGSSTLQVADFAL